MVGDGGLAMTLAELETVTRLRLPVTVVVFDDAALSLIEIKQKPGQGGPEAVRFGPIDYAAVAAAMGLDAAVAATQKELSVLLDAGWDRPRLIDARIDPATYTRLITATRG
jgi:acetolactate synthase-1/2/3 large subunit